MDSCMTCGAPFPENLQVSVETTGTYTFLTDDGLVQGLELNVYTYGTQDLSCAECGDDVDAWEYAAKIDANAYRILNIELH